MKISEILASARQKLEKFSETPALDAEIFLAEVLQKPREFLFARPHFRLSPAQIQKFGIFLQKRISGFSVAAIVKKKDFFGREFFVDENVLIPRPETEILFEKMRDALREKKSGTVVDVGTGSGILAISLFLEFPKKFEISAIDFSEKALKIAKKNAEKFSAKIHFFQKNFRDFDFQNLKKPLFLAANLPYVPENETHFSTKKEPKNAIFSGADGLDDFRDFFRILEKVDFDAVFFEFHPPQKSFFEKYFAEKFPEFSAKFFRDFSGFWRVGVLKKSFD